MKTNCKNCAKELNYKHVISADKQMTKLSFLCDVCQTITTTDSELKLDVREKPETKRSCFICKSSDFCKHFDHAFNKGETPSFMDDIISFISELGESMGKRCRNFFELQNKEKIGIEKNIDVCRWEIVSLSFENGGSKLFKTSCGLNIREYNIFNVNWEMRSRCNCNKKIEVVENGKWK